MKPTHAVNFESKYDIDYYVEDTTTRVEMNITLTNPSSNLYFKSYSLVFPESFAIDEVHALQHTNELPITIEKVDGGSKVNIEFNTPNGETTVTGSNEFKLLFNQKNLFKTRGNIVEVILPTIDNKDYTDFNINVHLPSNFSKKVGIAKPLPTLIRDNIIHWEHVKTKTVYVIFGDSQIYNLDLTYHLKNPESHPVYVDIPFPPETEYQSILVDSINPKPVKVFLDEDGNYMARYNILIAQQLNVQFKGFAQVFVQPQPEMQIIQEHRLSASQYYLLTAKNLWDIGTYASKEPIKDFISITDIFNYVTTTLTYNYSRINSDINRLGALAILKNPTLAVCTEFTDLFIGIAREKGFLTREIEGYGFTDDQKFRPQSDVTDILHSWPEYYDKDKKQWIAVDPTWQQTSGIDYFTSLDLNHIAFVIHGKDPQKPYPAGSYKTDKTKDVLISIASSLPTSKKTYSIATDVGSFLIKGKKIKAEIKIINTGNVYLKNEQFTIQTKNIKTSKKMIQLDLLPPMGTAVIPLEFEAEEDKNDGYIQIINKENKVIIMKNARFQTAFELWHGTIALSLVIGAIFVGIFISRSKIYHE